MQNLDISEYQQFLEFKKFQEIQRQLKMQAEAAPEQPAVLQSKDLNAGVEDATNKENQHPNLKVQNAHQNISSSKVPDSENPGPSQDANNCAIKAGITTTTAQPKQAGEPVTSAPRPAGESSSEEGPTIEELKAENQSYSSQGSNLKKPGETGSSLQKSQKSRLGDKSLKGQKLNFEQAPKNESNRDNDFEIEDIMMTNQPPLPESMSSNQSYLQKFMDGDSPLDKNEKSLTESEENALKRMRLSASPYYPKAAGKGLGEHAANSECQSTESDIMQNEQLRAALATLKDCEHAVEVLKLILNQLNEEQCKQIYSHLGIQQTGKVKSDKEYSLQMQKYQEEIQHIKSEWMSLRDQNKQNLKRIENLQDALSDVKFQKDQLEQEKQVHKDFMEKFEKNHLNQRSQCTQCRQKQEVFMNDPAESKTRQNFKSVSSNDFDSYHTDRFGQQSCQKQQNKPHAYPKYNDFRPGQQREKRERGQGGQAGPNNHRSTSNKYNKPIERQGWKDFNEDEFNTNKHNNRAGEGSDSQENSQVFGKDIQRDFMNDNDDLKDNLYENQKQYQEEKTNADRKKKQKVRNYGFNDANDEQNTDFEESKCAPAKKTASHTSKKSVSSMKEMNSDINKEVEESDDYEIIPVQSMRSPHQNNVSSAKSEGKATYDQEACFDEKTSGHPRLHHELSHISQSSIAHVSNVSDSKQASVQQLVDKEHREDQEASTAGLGLGTSSQIQENKLMEQQVESAGQKSNQVKSIDSHKDAYDHFMQKSMEVQERQRMSQQNMSKSTDKHESALSERIKSPKDAGMNESFENEVDDTCLNSQNDQMRQHSYDQGPTPFDDDEMGYSRDQNSCYMSNAHQENAEEVKEVKDNDIQAEEEQKQLSEANQTPMSSQCSQSVGKSYLNDQNVLAKMSQRNQDDQAQNEEYLKESENLEIEALGAPSQNLREIPELKTPKIVCKESELSPLAKDFLDKLQAALLQGDGATLSDLIFDAECENLGNQIDINWYEEQAAGLVERAL